MGLVDKVTCNGCECLRRKKKDVGEPVPESESKALEAETPAEAESGGRIKWNSPTEFLLTCIGYSVGLGNVWRFPYLCYKSGGGAFMLPYLIMMILIGMPLLFMEYAFGQYFGIGSLSIFKKVCPMFQGIGIGYIILNALVAIYYNVIIGISLYYLFWSFRSTLPWGNCDNEWNTPQCGDPIKNPCTGNETYPGFNMTGSNYTGINTTMCTFVNMTGNSTNITRVSPSEEFFTLRLLGRTPEHNVENLGEVRWELCLCLLLAWILVVLFVSRGIRSTGKVAYFTATFPYIMLTVLVIRGVTLPGAANGILYFVTPDWSKLKDPAIWFGAATQLFYSTNLAWGGMITMASYNEFNHNCFKDAIVINIVSFLTSLYAGFAVFSIIGYMAQEYNQEIEDVIKSGPGLAFIAYPRALSLMPLAPMWSFLFFFMLFLLGIGSQMVIVETVITGFVDEFPLLGRNGKLRLATTCFFAIIFFTCGIWSTTQMVLIETVVTGLVDEFPKLALSPTIRLLTTVSGCLLFFLCGIPMTFKMVDIETVMSGICDEFPHLRKHRFPILLLVASIFFLGGLPMVFQGGMHVLQLMDWYAAGFCVLIIAIVECVVINWVYRNERFAANIKEMLGHTPHRWWRFCWKYISPMLILAILIFSLVQYKPASYGDYLYPIWADGIGWLMTLASVIPILVVAIYKFVTAEGSSMLEKWKNATRPIVTLESKEDTVKALETLTHTRTHDMMSDEGEGEGDGDGVLNNELEAQKQTLIVDKADISHHNDDDMTKV